MMTSIDPVSNAQEDESRFVVMPPDPAVLFEGDVPLSEDQYADSELRTRHERTERMIRKAQEQV